MNREVNASPVAVVKLLSAVHLPVCHSAVVPVQVKGAQGSALIEQCKPMGLQIEQSLVEAKKDGVTTSCITNHGKTTCNYRLVWQVIKAGIETGNETKRNETSRFFEHAI